MAAVVTFSRVYTSGLLQNFSVYAVWNVDASDTIALSADYYSLTSAFWIPSTGSSSAGTASPSGTTVTIPASANNDDGWIVCVGARQQTTLTSP